MDVRGRAPKSARKGFGVKIRDKSPAHNKLGREVGENSRAPPMSIGVRAA